MDYLYIGSAPCDEACAQIGITEASGHYNRLECRAYIDALRIVYGNEPQGAFFTLKSEHHDYGSYCEVVIKYDENNDEACEYAFKVESGLATWDEAGMTAPVKYDDKHQVAA